MVDTKRTQAELIALYADGQAAGSLTAQKHRDIIVSVAPSFGGANMTENTTETTINTVDVFENISGTFIANATLKDVTVNAAGGILTYTGAPDCHFHVVSNLSFTTASNNKVIKVQWFKNGSTGLPVHIERLVGTGSDIGSSSVHADVMLSTGDTLEMKVTNATDATNMTIRDVYTSVIGMFS